MIDWDKRHKASTGNGKGSEGELYTYKLDTMQGILDEYSIHHLLDIGCGDGSQLRELELLSYLGADVSEVAIKKAQENANYQKDYAILGDYNKVSIEAHCSLDVICYLDDKEYGVHMTRLFDAEKYVILYTENHDGKGLRLSDHMHFRKIDTYIEETFPDWELAEKLDNPYKATHTWEMGKTFAEFYIYKRKEKDAGRPKRKRKTLD